MSVKSTDGRPYLKTSEAHAGLAIELDDGFTCCKAGPSTLKANGDELYFTCDIGRHYLSGQREDNHYIGIFKAEA